MSDPTLALLIRGTLAVLLVVGAGFCLAAGVRLLFLRKQAAVSSSFQATVGKHKVSFTAGTAGTCVVMTSAIWVICAVLVTPRYRAKPGETEVASRPIQFAPAQTALSQDQMAELDAFVAKLGTARTSSLLEIKSYAALPNGTGMFNQGAAEARAKAVKEYLGSKYGLSPSRTLLVPMDASASTAMLPIDTVIVEVLKRAEDSKLKNEASRPR